VAKVTHGTNQVSTGTGYDLTRTASHGTAEIYFPVEKQQVTSEKVRELCQDAKPTMNAWEKLTGKVAYAFQLVVTDMDVIMNILCLNLQQRRATVEKSRGRPNRMWPTTRQQWPRKTAFAPAKTRTVLLALIDIFTVQESQPEAWRFSVKQFVALKHADSRASPKQVWLVRHDVSQGKSAESNHSWPAVGFTVRRIDSGATPADAMWGSVPLNREVFLLAFRVEKHSSECLEKIGGHLVVAKLAQERDLRGSLIKVENDNLGATEGKNHELVTFMVDTRDKVLQVRKGFRQEGSHRKREFMKNEDALSKGILDYQEQIGTRWIELPLTTFLADVNRVRRNVNAWEPADKVTSQPKYKFSWKRDSLPDGWKRSLHSQHLTSMLAPDVEFNATKSKPIETNRSGEQTTDKITQAASVLSMPEPARGSYSKRGGFEGEDHRQQSSGDGPQPFLQTPAKVQGHQAGVPARRAYYGSPRSVRFIHEGRGKSQ
jgi:hypothetical protein